MSDAPPAGADASVAQFGRAAAWIQVYVNASAGEVWTEGLAGIYEEAWPDPYTEAEREGSCRRLTSEVPFCDPPCAAGLCTAPDVCSAYPEALSAGVIGLAGGGTTRTLDPPAYSLYQIGAVWPAETEITATAPGATYPAFSLAAPLGPPLAVTPPGVTLTVGSPVTFTWTPGSVAAARVRVELIADRGHAAVHPSVIECDVEDAAGSLTVPQGMIDAHADRTNWSCGDCYTSWITRYAAARTTTGGGELELWVGSRQSVYATPQ